MAYIDVDKLIDKINSRIKNTLIRGWLASIINETLEEEPTADVVEVVRCGKCNHCRKYRNLLGVDCYECLYEDKFEPVNPIHFCSYGERKKNDKE